MKLEMSVPEDKIAKAIFAIDEVRHASFAYVESVQRLLGILAFVGRVLLSGSWHLAATITGLRVSSITGFVKVSQLWCDELDWWAELLTRWNCKALMVPRKWTPPTYETTFFTDASRSKAHGGGAGGIFKQMVFQFDFSSEEIDGMEIADLEGLAHFLFLAELCARCPEELEGKRFITRCDNMNFVDAVNRSKATTPSIAFLVGEVHKLQALHSFDLRLIFVPSKDNEMADALSRKAWKRVAAFIAGRTWNAYPQLRSNPLTTDRRCLEWDSFVTTLPDVVRAKANTLCWISVQEALRFRTASSMIQRRRWARHTLLARELAGRLP